MSKRLMLASVIVLLVGVSAPAGAGAKGYIAEPLQVGYFYGTFDEGPNVALLAGGTAEDFCEDNPVDPFNGAPGVAPSRVFLRNDGAIDVKVNDKNQPIYIYDNVDDASTWIVSVCDGRTTPALLASGTANLKVRNSFLFEDGPPVHIFNSVNGRATGTDDSEYKVRAWADIPFENGAPVGAPPDWVGLVLTEIRR